MASSNTKRKVKKEGLDLYRTSVTAMKSAINAGVFDDVSSAYDPCDGLGGISNPLEEAGIPVHRTDIFDHGNDKLDGLVNFLELSKTPAPDVDVLVMNPPFNLTYEFVEKALELHDRVFMFNRVSFLETKTRSAKLSSGDWPLKHVWFYGFRVGCAEGYTDEEKNAVFYAWYEFDKEFKGAPTMSWITEKVE